MQSMTELNSLLRSPAYINTIDLDNHILLSGIVFLFLVDVLPVMDAVEKENIRVSIKAVSEQNVSR